MLLVEIRKNPEINALLSKDCLLTIDFYEKLAHAAPDNTKLHRLDKDYRRDRANSNLLKITALKNLLPDIKNKNIKYLIYDEIGQIQNNEKDEIIPLHNKYDDQNNMYSSLWLDKYKNERGI